MPARTPGRRSSSAWAKALNIVLILVFLTLDSSHPATMMALAYSASYLVAAVATVVAANRKMPGSSRPRWRATGQSRRLRRHSVGGGDRPSPTALAARASDEWAQLLIAASCGAGGLALAAFGLHQYGFDMLRRRGSGSATSSG